MDTPRYTLRSSKRSHPVHYPSHPLLPSASQRHTRTTPTSVYQNLTYLTPTSQWYEPQRSPEVPSWNFLLASLPYPSATAFPWYPSHNSYSLPCKLSFCDLRILSTELTTFCPKVSPCPSNASSFSRSPHFSNCTSPAPSSLCSSPGPSPITRLPTPILAPIPRRGSKPVVLTCELPDLDEDLSHAPYIRPPKRKRVAYDDNSDEDRPARKLRRSTRLQA
ncbi:hypothetical protein DL96DRAFT_1056589 [Flagelloscypha sp. PMI_526]|nr:hypothetical protein DL96DRAFT_1056589 [Flagelloscypha sp. PMI_526]